jgi:hypothetical protein
MRHSSWTLFLVPLALPLVCFCFPGAMKTAEHETPASVEVQEIASDNASTLPESVALGGASGEDSPGSRSESLFQD